VTQNVDPNQTAKTAGCRYVDDAGVGITRVRHGGAFRYVDPKGHAITSRRTLARIASLAIPPAWENVWICPSPRGHIQATGRDARGRKQYRYHGDFRRARDDTKYHRLLAFADVLPKIRSHVDTDMQRSKTDREKVLATVVRLLEISLIRVGHDEYTRKNGSYGLTTLRTRHVDIHGSTIRFHFRAKSGLRRVVDVHDRKLARIVHRFAELPGEKLFQYIDESGRRRTIEANDVNAYLRHVTGDDFTAKDFRTWAGTVFTARALLERGAAEQAHVKRNIAEAIEHAAERLGNTPTVCRNCYVHPEVLSAYADGTLVDELSRADRGRSKLFAHEAAVVAFLRRRAAPQRRAA
jgi:DNA topoisomerase-1